MTFAVKTRCMRFLTPRRLCALFRVFALLTSAVTFPFDALALDESEIPKDAPDDAVMAAPAEIRQAWQDLAGFADAQPSGELPFSFRYGGVSSSELLPTWTRSTTNSETASRRIRIIEWQDPKTYLHVRATVTAFKRYPAAEWLLEFWGGGTKDSLLLKTYRH